MRVCESNELTDRFVCVFRLLGKSSSNAITSQSPALTLKSSLKTCPSLMLIFNTNAPSHPPACRHQAREMRHQQAG